MRILKKISKIIAYCIVVFFLISGLFYLLYNKNLPESKEGAAADSLAHKMLTALQYNKYKETRFLEWSFNGGSHKYKWDKTRGIVTVKWKNNTASLYLSNPSKNRVIVKNKNISSLEENMLIEKAIDFFNNDSFWLVAPFKVFDKGAKRSIVKLENGEKALLVSYTLGGTTPGDSYLWKLRSNGFPESFQMWVKIIPIGGIKASWEDWQVMKNGLLLPTKHKIGPFALDMGSVQAY